MAKRGPIAPMSRTGLIVRLLITAVAVVYIYKVITSATGSLPHH
jgi:hypothetical protein